MIVRFHIDPSDVMQQGSYDYRVSYEGEDLFEDTGLGSMATQLLFCKFRFLVLDCCEFAEIRVS